MSPGHIPPNHTPLQIYCVCPLHCLPATHQGTQEPFLLDMSLGSPQGECQIGWSRSRAERSLEVLSCSQNRKDRDTVLIPHRLIELQTLERYKDSLCFLPVLTHPGEEDKGSPPWCVSKWDGSPGGTLKSWQGAIMHSERRPGTIDLVENVWGRQHS